MRLGGDQDILRFMTCGSVDDGKSTLIGRLLYDLGQVFDDQVSQLEMDSVAYGSADGDLDFALLVDGLSAEREQGITIDVAYRYFATEKRKFIVADTPGHEQYTRNMATGASVSDLAVILIDARKGVVTQTRRHSAIVQLLGIKHVLVAINKMDLVGFDYQSFLSIENDYLNFARKLGLKAVTCVPLAARDGDNVVSTSSNMPWYSGPTLADFLDSVEIERSSDWGGLLFPVQWVNRPNDEFRGVSGTIVGGSVHPNDNVIVLPSAKCTRVKSIVTFEGTRDEAISGDAVTFVLEDDVDVSRGDVIASMSNQPNITDQFTANVIWLGDDPMLPGRPYIIKCGPQSVTGTVTALKHKVNIDTLGSSAGRSLSLNEIAVCNFSVSRPIVYTHYDENRELGAFIVIDKITSQTVGAGMIIFGLRRADNLHRQAIDIDRSLRAQQKGQKPFCLWFTGLSGSGKSTVANALDRRLFGMGFHAFILDGDNVRHGLNRDLGFTDADRVENIRRVAEVARLMVDAGLITIVSFISPFRSERQMARELFNDGEFLEAFVDAPLEVCEKRDVKGLYRRARAGEIKNFTGIDSSYEIPVNPEFRLLTNEMGVEEVVDSIIDRLVELDFI